MKACPCASGFAYSEGCGPLHRGEREAVTPEALMRSRFAAFALRDTAYLWRTMHADHEDRAVPEEQFARALRDGSRTLRYMRLAILEARDDRVLFLASVFEKGKDLSFVELSRFAHDGSGWRYLSGISLASTTAGELGELRSLTMDRFIELAAERVGASSSPCTP